MKAYPFAYNFGKDAHFTTFQEARKAKYRKSSSTDFDPNQNRDYFTTPDAPSPVVEEVDGYLSEEEVEEEAKAPEKQEESLADEIPEEGAEEALPEE